MKLSHAAYKRSNCDWARIKPNVFYTPIDARHVVLRARTTTTTASLMDAFLPVRMQRFFLLCFPQERWHLSAPDPKEQIPPKSQRTSPQRQWCSFLSTETKTIMSFFCSSKPYVDFAFLKTTIAHYLSHQVNAHCAAVVFSPLSSLQITSGRMRRIP